MYISESDHSSSNHSLSSSSESHSGDSHVSASPLSASPLASAASSPRSADPIPSDDILPLAARIINSKSLFGESRIIHIEHRGMIYRMSITNQNRLILQK